MPRNKKWPLCKFENHSPVSSQTLEEVNHPRAHESNSSEGGYDVLHRCVDFIDVYEELDRVLGGRMTRVQDAEPCGLCDKAHSASFLSAIIRGTRTGFLGDPND